MLYQSNQTPNFNTQIPTPIQSPINIPFTFLSLNLHGIGEVGQKRNQKCNFLKSLLRAKGDIIDIAFFQELNSAECPRSIFKNRLPEYQVFETTSNNRNLYDTAILVKRKFSMCITQLSLNSSRIIITFIMDLNGCPPE